MPANGRSVTVLFGPSGSGKTTILRCLAGLERPETGTIAFAGQTWLDTAAGVDLSPAHRRLGLLSQDYSLFPHLTVESNVGYGLRRMPRAQRLARVREMLDRFGLSPIALWADFRAARIRGLLASSRAARSASPPSVLSRWSRAGRVAHARRQPECWRRR